jgi:hypothetical protein
MGETERKIYRSKVCFGHFGYRAAGERILLKWIFEMQAVEFRPELKLNRISCPLSDFYSGIDEL